MRASNRPKSDDQSCYVFITLPGTTTPVVAGKYSFDSVDGTSTGQFVYGRSYLENRNAVELDPVELKLQRRIYETGRLQGVFGCLRDAGPDYWGRLVIEKHLARTDVNELEFLLFSPDDRSGALSFNGSLTPAANNHCYNQRIQLEKLQEIAHAIILDRSDSENTNAPASLLQATDLLLIGTSMGGARPKAVIEDSEGIYIAKFNRADDRWNNARVEHAMLSLAQRAGITVAQSRVESVAGRDLLLVKRFDRTKSQHAYFKSRMISALTLLQADDSSTDRSRWSYLLFAEELRRTVQNPKIDTSELFRRLCFNALISNTDDHPRNHALIAHESAWQLSPCYDLTPTPLTSVERRDLAMTCGRSGRYANRSNLLSEAGRFLLRAEEAVAIINSVQDVIAHQLDPTLEASGVSLADRAVIAPAFNYAGFELELL